MIETEKIIKRIESQIALCKEIDSDWISLTVETGKRILELLKEQDYRGWLMDMFNKYGREDLIALLVLHREEKLLADALKEQEQKEIKAHKKHVITWKRDDEFTMRRLYEAICETLLDEGELFIARTDDHEKVDFVFYVAEGR